jgi:hypothetical protein
MRFVYMTWITTGIGVAIVAASILFAIWRSG